MASPQDKAVAVREATSSISTCTASTTITLEGLLSQEAITINEPLSDARKRAKPSLQQSKPASRTRTNISKAKKSLHVDNDEERLSQKEKSTLATDVINAALKALSEAIKTPIQARRQSSSKDLVKASLRKTLRRSNSMPQSPLQPPSLNRISSSPNISCRSSRSSSSASASSAGHRPVADCARLALAYLRATPNSKSAATQLQVENAMSVLVNKLISLGFDDLAIKELRILHRRLAPGSMGKKPLDQGVNEHAKPQSLSQLLDFRYSGADSGYLCLIIATQIQVLRLMTIPRNRKDIESAINILKPSHPSSPMKLIISTTSDQKQLSKAVRHLKTLSDILLSLTPSISASDDALALDLRLSVAPGVALQLQSLALQSRLIWWRLADHRGELCKDLVDPFFRCISAFARRNRGSATVAYELVSCCLADFEARLRERNISRNGMERTFIGIYRLLATLSNTASLTERSIDWAEKAQLLVNAQEYSDAIRYGLIAKLAALKLQHSPADPSIEELLFALLEGLEGPFRGGAGEIEELFIEISALRRAAITLLSRRKQSEHTSSKDGLPMGTCQMCESMVLRCPRLLLRYLGNMLSVNAAAKDLIRYEQRKKFVLKSGTHAIDSALFLIKTCLAEDRMTWDTMDAVLQDCLALYDRFEDSTVEASTSHSGQATSYYVRLSNLYFTHFFNMRRDGLDAKNARFLRVLRRSVDCLQSRSLGEKRAGVFSAKLEKLADFCKSTGRNEELSTTLLRLRDYFIEDGILSSIVMAANSQPLRKAWTNSDQATDLGRIIAAHFRIQMKQIKDAPQVLLVEDSWSIEEKGIVLEHQLDVLLGLPSHTLSSPSLAEDLRDHLLYQLMRTYSQDVYPLRRLRAQTRYLSVHRNCYPSTLDMIAENLVRLVKIEVIMTKDAGLLQFSEHFQALIMNLIELHLHEQRLENLVKGVTYWCSLVKDAHDLATIHLHVDDLPALLTHLQLLGDYMQVKGSGRLRIAVLQLIVDLTGLNDGSPNKNQLVIAFTDLAEQWLQLGYTGKAMSALHQAQTHVQQSPLLSLGALHFHLCYASYLIAVREYEKSSEHFLLAQAVFTREEKFMAKLTTTQERMVRGQAIATASRISSLLEMERGAVQPSVLRAIETVKLLRRSWVTLEGQIQKENSLSEEARSISDETSTEMLQPSESTIMINVTAEHPLAGACFWPLVGPLFSSLTSLSTLYAHHGMFQETAHYAEQALKLAKELGSDALVAMASVTLGDVWSRAGFLDQASESLKMAKDKLGHDQSTTSVALSYHFGHLSGLLGDVDAELTAYSDGEALLNTMSNSEFILKIDQLVDPVHRLLEGMSSLTLSKRRNKVSSKAISGSQVGKKAKNIANKHTTIERRLSSNEDCFQKHSIRVKMLHQKANALMLRKSYSDAYTVLNEASKSCSSRVDVVYQAIGFVKRLLLESTDLMIADPVYSVLQDSTISFPSIGAHSKVDRNTLDRLTISKHAPPPKGHLATSSRSRDKSKSPGIDSFLDKLCQAQDKLLEVYFDAVSIAPTTAVHTIAALLNSVAILLSAAGAGKGRSLGYPGFASCSIETARMLSMRRERAVFKADASINALSSSTPWPALTALESRRSSLAISSSDMTRFQRDYIDIIPQSWTAISISISESRQELSITRLQAGHNPFILRLPLGRNNSRDADEEMFGFEEGKAEMLDIIELANESAHDSRELSTKEAKLAWWETRESLDTRLQCLLENIERVWLGGFTGIFSQHMRRPDLLSRFQVSFQNILDKHLPSRRKTKRKNMSSSPRITLDARVLDLFVGFGDASADDCDLSEPLMDLLYFVVDILQFHGELNAYAEIDFDSILLETHDALRCYHEAARASDYCDEGRHNILILDKELHAFPWESLPCMEGLAVSRVPSLGCLKDRILAQHFDCTNDRPRGLYAKSAKGSYILNPSGDLQNTQATFQYTLAKLDNWDGIIGRGPSEIEVKTMLQSNDLFLYFGHGSGAQYIRAKEIRKLEQTAVTFLMGCSSGVLTEVGEFESYGTPIQYMHAGCPALIATLWDVTDKDIDKFAMNTFKSWGLLDSKEDKKQVAAKGRRRKRKEEETTNASEAESLKISVVEAVSRSRKVCNLRYLNGAAVCVYGVPVYLE